LLAGPLRSALAGEEAGVEEEEEEEEEEKENDMQKEERNGQNFNKRKNS
jgi:hypothetical protein